MIIILFFGDESIWVFITELGRVWAKEGIRPILEMSFKREWIAVVFFVEPLTGRFVSLIIGSLNTNWF